MKLPSVLRGMPQVARQEFVTNLKSVRFIIMILLTALVIVGGSLGFGSILSSGVFGGLPSVQTWGHPAWAANGSHVAVIWVSDAYGAPVAGRTVRFTERLEPSGAEVEIGTVATDAAGFARLNVGNRTVVDASVQIGGFTSQTTASFFDPLANFTVESIQGDYRNTGRRDGMALSVLDRAGDPADANVSVNGTLVGTTDGYGFLLITLPVGSSTVMIEVAGQTQTFTPQVIDTGGSPFASGPDFVLFLISALSSWIFSIFAIVLTFDAVARERVQGTMDLLLSRPASRSGVLLGKLLGAFGAIALPVTLVNLAGIGAIAAVSGKAPTGWYAAAFVGGSLLLIAFFVMIMLIFSAYAKTSGTAIMAGFLVWLLLIPMYGILTSLLGGAVLGSGTAAYYRFQQVSGLLNPASVCSLILSLAAPPSLTGGQGVALDPIVVAAAGVVWFAVLLALALWTFHRKAAE